MRGRELNRLLAVSAADNVDAGDELLGLDERPVAEQRLPAADTDCRNVESAGLRARASELADGRRARRDARRARGEGVRAHGGVRRGDQRRTSRSRARPTATTRASVSRSTSRCRSSARTACATARTRISRARSTSSAMRRAGIARARREPRRGRQGALVQQPRRRRRGARGGARVRAAGRGRREAHEPVRRRRRGALAGRLPHRARGRRALSAFGGIVALNREVDEATAKLLAETFLECVVAPSFAAAALEMLRAKKNLRLLATGAWLGRRSRGAPVQARRRRPRRADSRRDGGRRGRRAARS